MSGEALVHPNEGHPVTAFVKDDADAAQQAGAVATAD
jgi:hypothetical protein